MSKESPTVWAAPAPRDELPADIEISVSPILAIKVNGESVPFQVRETRAGTKYLSFRHGNRTGSISSSALSRMGVIL